MLPQTFCAHKTHLGHYRRLLSNINTLRAEARRCRKSNPVGSEERYALADSLEVELLWRSRRISNEVYNRHLLAFVAR